MTRIFTLTAEPTHFCRLDAGLYFVPEQHYALCIIQHHGVNVALQYDTRGPDSDYHFQRVVIEMHYGREMDFNEVDDARRFIDEELGVDVDYDFDPVREWGVR